MRAKLTILFTAVLVLALGASQVYAQAGGYGVSREIETVAQHGKNQMVGQILLTYDANGGIIDAGASVSFTFGGLPISVNGEATCAGGVTCTSADDLSLNEAKDTLTLATGGTVAAGATVSLDGVRVDVSSLDVGDHVMATISTTAPTGLIPVGQSRRGSVSTEVGVVAAGLTVKVTAASRLICNLDETYNHDNDDGTTPEIPVGGIPMITVSEGFDDAWEPAANLGGTTIRVKVLNLPAGVSLRWPRNVTFGNDTEANISTLALAGNADGEDVEQIATDGNDLEADDGDNGADVLYDYAITAAGTGDNEAGGEMDSFAIPITVVTGDIATGAGGIADIWGILHPAPAADDADTGTVLSYVMMPVTDPMTDEGDFLNIAECVTYLLFPYITCGAHADWDTGIAIANTSMDDGIFGLSTGATAQTGAVYLHAYPTGAKDADGSTMEGYMGMATTVMLSGGLAAGDSLAIQCGENAMLAGMQGYAIAKAGFRHGHGMAFVMNVAGGTVNAAHGYAALVIPDPEFDETSSGRAPAAGESLGH